MFGLLNDVLSVAVKTVTLPVSVAADVVTMGGLLNDKPCTYTGENLDKLMDKIEKLGD
jgi:hypothetical protein